MYMHMYMDTVDINAAHEYINMTCFIIIMYCSYILHVHMIVCTPIYIVHVHGLYRHVYE